MSLELKIEWKGLKEFERQLTDFLPELTRQLEKKMREGAKEVRDEAQRLAPVDTGSLRDSIRLSPQQKRAGVFYSIGVSAGGENTRNRETGQPIDYAGYQEFGNSRVPTHPYMRPAVANKQTRFIQLLKEAVSAATKK